MTKQLLNLIFIGLLSLLVVACGDAGDHEVGDEAGFEEEVDQNDDPNLEEEVDDENEIEDEDLVDAPFCGDGFVDEGEACDDANEVDGDGCSSDCELEALETEGQMSINIVIDDLTSNEQPLEDTCSGTIEIQIDAGLVVGAGRCFLDNNANFLDYAIDAEVDESGAVDGEVEIILNTRPHVLVVTGSLDQGQLSLEFDGVTLVTQNIRAVWNGEVEADFN